MSEDKDYDVVMAKLPRYDKAGNDVSCDKIGKGGRHRSDGTYSATVYDIKIVGEKERLPEPIQPKEPSLGQQIGRDIIYDVGLPLLEWATDYLFDRAVYGIHSWWENRQEKKRREAELEHERRINEIRAQRFAMERKAQLQRQEDERVEAARKAEQEKAIMSVNQAISPSPAFNSAYNDFCINMTSDEARKEFIDAFMLYMLSAQKMQRLAHATITDEKTGENISGSDWVESLCKPEILGNINAVLSANPGLLEQWQSVALESILGRELVLEGRYIPIEAEPLRVALLR